MNGSAATSRTLPMIWDTRRTTNTRTVFERRPPVKSEAP
jgi:hypothetical protein